METRRTNKKNVANIQDRVDTGVSTPVVSGSTDLGREVRPALSQLDKAEGGGRTIIHENAWYEFILIAQYLYKVNPDAEVADVFEFLRMKDMGGTPITAGLLKRVNREIATELGPWE
jgi:hypothetical protein